jgi:hypothetical protein
MIFQVCDCDTDHYLVIAKAREGLAVSKQASQKFDVEIFNRRKLNELEVRKRYQFEITKSFVASQAKPSQAKPSQAKPSQAKVLTGGGDLREEQVDFPCLLAIPAFDRKAGLNNRHLNSNRGVCLR